MFVLAIIHGFSTGIFACLAHREGARHAGLWHLLSEVEVIFGFWAIILIVLMGILAGKDHAVEYLDTRNYTEPLFIFAIMVVAASRPILQLATLILNLVTRLAQLPTPTAYYFTLLIVVPLLGSFIT